jgi:hypothetical protein
MRVRKLETRGVAGLPDGKLDFTVRGKAASTVVLTGGAAAGKSRALDAIVAAKSDVAPSPFRPVAHDFVRAGAEACKIIVEWEFDANEVRRFALKSDVAESETILGARTSHAPPADAYVAIALGAYDHSRETGKLELFGADRALAPRSGVALDENAQRRWRGSKDAAKYAFVGEWLVETMLGFGRAGGERDPLTELRRLLQDLAPSVTLAGLERADNGERRVLFEGRFGRRTLPMLSSVERDALIFAATAVFVGLSRSVLLLDGPEIHVGPKDRPRWAAGLRALGDDNQLVVATSDPTWIRSGDAVVLELGGAAREVGA